MPTAPSGGKAGPWLGLLLGLAGCLGLGLAAATLLLGADHGAHAYDATLWVIRGLSCSMPA